MCYDRVGMQLLPKTPKFFDLFENLASLTKKVARILDETKVGKDPKSIRESARKARALEEKADRICHKIFVEADGAFLTPIDREDIYLLAKSLDNVIDLIENVSSNLYLYKVTKATIEFKKFRELVVLISKEVYLLISELEKERKDIKKMRKHIIKIHSLENEGDELLGRAIKNLFSNHKSGIEIIKWKDIYENLESVLDECEDAADVVNTIIVKNY